MKANKKYIKFYTFPFHCLGEILICDQLLIQLSLLFKVFLQIKIRNLYLLLFTNFQ